MADTRTVVETIESGGTVLAKRYSDGSILINGVRFSYPHVFEKFGKEGQKKKYSLTGWMPKATHGKVWEMLQREGKKLLAEKKVDLRDPARFYYRDGTTVSADADDSYVIVSSEDNRPSVRGPRKEKLTQSEGDELIFGGVWGNMLIKPWWQNHAEGGKRINAGFLACQYIRTGEPLGEGNKISEEDIDDTFDSDGGDPDEEI